MSELSGDQAIRFLAAAVVRRAFDDLAHLNLEIQKDAFNFLTERLWEPECLWQKILYPTLVRARVVQEAHDRLEAQYSASYKTRNKGGTSEESLCQDR